MQISLSPSRLVCGMYLGDAERCLSEGDKWCPFRQRRLPEGAAGRVVLGSCGVGCACTSLPGREFDFHTIASFEIDEIGLWKDASSVPPPGSWRAAANSTRKGAQGTPRICRDSQTLSWLLRVATALSCLNRLIFFNQRRGLVPQLMLGGWLFPLSQAQT